VKLGEVVTPGGEKAAASGEERACAGKVFANLGEVLTSGGEDFACGGRESACAGKVFANVGEVFASRGEDFACGGGELACAGKVSANGGEIFQASAKPYDCQRRSRTLVERPCGRVVAQLGNGAGRSGPRNRFLACRQERPQHLGAGEGARHQGALALQIAAQRGGFGLAHRQLHDG
jgi:hypothetical protein